MSGGEAARTAGTGRTRRLRLLQLPMLVWLTVLWAVLWGSWAPLTLVGGFLVAVLACVLFPLPPLRLATTVRPWPLALLIGRFALDVVVSSVQVALVVLRPARPLRNAIVEVRLRTPSDFVLTVVAEMTCLIPGSLVVEAHRSTHTLLLHVLDVGDDEGAERFRRGVLDQEARVVRAIGRRTDHLDERSGSAPPGPPSPSPEEPS